MESTAIRDSSLSGAIWEQNTLNAGGDPDLRSIHKFLSQTKIEGLDDAGRRFTNGDAAG
jgi:hypothetical protein